MFKKVDKGSEVNFFCWSNRKVVIRVINFSIENNLEVRKIIINPVVLDYIVQNFKKVPLLISVLHNNIVNTIGTDVLRLNHFLVFIVNRNLVSIEAALRLDTKKNKDVNLVVRIEKGEQNSRIKVFLVNILASDKKDVNKDNKDGIFVWGEVY